MRTVAWCCAPVSEVSTVALPAFSVPAPAEAYYRHYHHHYRHYAYYRPHHYYGRSYYGGYCRRRSGTTGAIVGGVGGALLGHAIAGGLGGTLVGAGAGALLGRHIERHSLGHRCYR